MPELVLVPLGWARAKHPAGAALVLLRPGEKEPFCPRALPDRQPGGKSERRRRPWVWAARCDALACKATLFGLLEARCVY